ncbi:MAG: zinc ribbon domain-containing protein [Spirochaetales bacterium]|nr:zinc ribbon domain-containing protein [Spirochaetales bacterium]
MKFLIWITCLFINASIMTLSKEGNVALGAIPMFILISGMMWLATTLCKKWDEHKEAKEVVKKAYTCDESAVVKTESIVRFCSKCGEKLINNSQFCRKYGTEVEKE